MDADNHGCVTTGRLNARLAELKDAILKHQATLAALNGAKQQVELFLAEVNNGEQA